MVWRSWSWPPPTPIPIIFSRRILPSSACIACSTPAVSRSKLGCATLGAEVAARKRLSCCALAIAAWIAASTASGSWRLIAAHRDEKKAKGGVDVCLSSWIQQEFLLSSVTCGTCSRYMNSATISLYIMISADIGGFIAEIRQHNCDCV